MLVLYNLFALEAQKNMKTILNFHLAIWQQNIDILQPQHLVN